MLSFMMNTGGLATTNCFLVGDETTKEAVIFDAPNDTLLPLLDEASRRGWKVIGLWLTHGHFDHIADHALVKARFPESKLLMHALDESKLRKPGSQLFPLPFQIPPGAPDGLIEDGQILKLGESEIHAIYTPGHSPGHVMFHFPKERILIGGDLIIMGAVGRTDFPDADYATLQASIRRVMELPPETRLLPGHGQASTLAEERRNNPYVAEALAAAK